MSEAALDTRVAILENEMVTVKDRVECVEVEQKEFVRLQLEILKKINGMTIKIILALGAACITLVVFIYLNGIKP